MNRRINTDLGGTSDCQRIDPWIVACLKIFGAEPPLVCLLNSSWAMDVGAEALVWLAPVSFDPAPTEWSALQAFDSCLERSFLLAFAPPC
jgi:hypothetical protein